MHHVTANTSTTSLKLFPRLAMPKPTPKSPRSKRTTAGSCRAATSHATADSARAQVRARLLRMIINNEQARRNEQRPNAS